MALSVTVVAPLAVSGSSRGRLRPAPLSVPVAVWPPDSWYVTEATGAPGSVTSTSRTEPDEPLNPPGTHPWAEIAGVVAELNLRPEGIDVERGRRRVTGGISHGQGVLTVAGDDYLVAARAGPWTGPPSRT